MRGKRWIPHTSIVNISLCQVESSVSKYLVPIVMSQDRPHNKRKTPDPVLRMELLDAVQCQSL